MSQASTEKYSVIEEYNLPTIQEESDENITILVDTLDDALDKSIKKNTFDKFSHSSINSKLPLNPNEDACSRNSFYFIKSLSLEKRALLIGISVIGIIILIGIFIGFVLLGMVQYNSEKSNALLTDLHKYVRI